MITKREGKASPLAIFQEVTILGSLLQAELLNIPLFASYFKNQLIGSTFSAAGSSSSECHLYKIIQLLPLVPQEVFQRMGLPPV